MPLDPVNGSWMPWPNANATSFYGLLQYGNSVTNDLFGASMLFVVFIVCYISMRKYPARESFTVSGFVASIMAVLMELMGLIGDQFVILFIFITAISFIFMMKEMG